MDIPTDARRRIAKDRVVWLTTVTDRTAPAPNPVWFVPDGDDLLVFTSPDSLKVRNIERRPSVALNFNSDAEGGDVVIISGEATVEHGRPPSAAPGYVDKYASAIADELGMTVGELDAGYNTEIRIRLKRFR